MTREEAIKVLSSYDVNGVWADVDGKPYNAEEQAEAFDMAIEALEGMCFDEWCYECKEYDTEKKCCPRFNKVIREALKREPSEDGTLEVKVEDATKIGRVLVSDDEHRGGLYYPDEDEPQKSYPTEWCEQCDLWKDNKCVGVAQCKHNIEALKHVTSDDLISRAEAIEAIEIIDWYHQNSNKDMVHGANDDEHQAWYKADDVYKALEAIPSVDKQRNGDLISRAEAIEALRYAQHRFTVADEAGGMGSVKWSEDVIYFAAAERVLTELPSADRPRPIDPTCAVDLESGVVPRSACEPRGPKTIIYADRIYSERPKGRWHYSDGKPATIGQSFGVICDQCGTESEYCTNFCGERGADMRGGTE